MRKCLILLLLLLSVNLFGQKTDSSTIVTQPLKPNDYRDSTATHIDIYGQGGLSSVADSSAMLSIMRQRRKLGMVVYLRSVQRYYQLKTSLTNTGWVLFTTGGSGTPIDTSLLEHKSNKSTNLTSPNNTTYPTTLAVSNAMPSLTGYIQYTDTGTGHKIAPMALLNLKLAKTDTTNKWLPKHGKADNSAKLQGIDTIWIKDLVANGESDIYITLSNNQTSDNKLLGDTSKEYMGTYTIDRDTSTRFGLLRVRIKNHHLLYDLGDYVESNNLGIKFNKFVLTGSNIYLNYTSTNTGHSAALTYRPIARGVADTSIQVVSVNVISPILKTGTKNVVIRADTSYMNGSLGTWAGENKKVDKSYLATVGHTASYHDLVDTPQNASLNSGFLYFNGHTYLEYPAQTDGKYYTTSDIPVHSSIHNFDGIIRAFGLGTKDYYFPLNGTSGQILKRGTGTATTWSNLILAKTKTNTSHQWFNSYDSLTGLFTSSRPSYHDLIDTPSVMSQVNSDWNSVSGVSQILHKPYIPVNTSSPASSNIITGYTNGTWTWTPFSYNYLTNLPQLPISKTAPSHEWLRTFTSGTGIFTSSRPDLSDLTGTAVLVNQSIGGNFNFVNSNGYSTILINNSGGFIPVTKYSLYDGIGALSSFEASAILTPSIKQNGTEYIHIGLDINSVYGVQIGGSYLPRSVGGNGSFIQTTNTSYGLTGWSSYSLPTSAGSNGQILTSNGTNLVLVTPPTPTFSTLTTNFPNTITWNVTTNKNVTTTLINSGGNPTLAIAGGFSGAVGIMEIIQCPAGGKQLVWPSGSKFKGGVKIISDVANSINVISFVYDGTNYLWNIGTDYTP